MTVADSPRKPPAVTDRRYIPKTMNTTTDYHLATLRARFAARGYQPLNRRRLTMDHYIGFGLLATALLVPAIAAAIITLL